MIRPVFAFLTRPLIGSGIGCYRPLWSLYVFLCNILSRKDIVDVHGFKMLRKTCEDFPSIVLSGEYEELNTQIFSKLINSGSVVVDIGAHAGFYTLLARSLGARVYAFEPEIKHRDFLVENILLNGFNDIIVANMAISNECSISALRKSNFRGAQYTLYPTGDDDECSLIRVTTLDDFFKYTNKIIDIVKIDTEGMETSVLEGMKDVIGRNENIKIMLEFSRAHLVKAGSSAEKLWDTLQSLGLGYIYSLSGRIRRCEFRDVIRISTKFGRDVGATLLCSRHEIGEGILGG